MLVDCYIDFPLLKDRCHGTKLNMMWFTNTDVISDVSGGRSIVTNLRFGRHLSNRVVSEVQVEEISGN